MNGSTLKILMALGIAHIAISASSEAGNKERKSHRKHKAAKERKSAKKEHVLEHDSQNEHSAEKTPSRAGSHEPNEDSVLSEKSQRESSRKNSHVEAAESLDLPMGEKRSSEGIEILASAPADARISAPLVDEAPVVADEVPVQAEDIIEIKPAEAANPELNRPSEAQPNANPVPQEEHVPSARMTEEQIAESFKELKSIQDQLQSKEMATELITFMQKLCLSSPLLSKDQELTLDQMVQRSCDAFSPAHDLIKRKEALMTAVKAEEKFYQQDCTGNADLLKTQIEDLNKTTKDLNARTSLDWHVAQIKKLEAEKAAHQKSLKQAKENLPKLDAAHKNCTDETKKDALLHVHEECKKTVNDLSEKIEQLSNDIQSASDLKATVIRVTENEKKLHILESQIANSTSQATIDKLESEKTALEKSIKKDQMNEYYENLNVLKSTKAEQEKQKAHTEALLQKMTEEKASLTHQINFYELDWEGYVKIMKEKTQTDLSLKSKSEVVDKQEKEIKNLQLGQSRLRQTVRNLNEELEDWKHNKKKSGILSKLNPFRLFKRKHKHTED